MSCQRKILYWACASPVHIWYWQCNVVVPADTSRLAVYQYRTGKMSMCKTVDHCYEGGSKTVVDRYHSGNNLGTGPVLFQYYNVYWDVLWGILYIRMLLFWRQLHTIGKDEVGFRVESWKEKQKRTYNPSSVTRIRTHDALCLIQRLSHSSKGQR